LIKEAIFVPESQITLDRPPRLTTNADGKPTDVLLDASTYIRLLINANIKDKELWPPNMEYATNALERIGQIESECISQYGEFDWEKLTEKEQDEYDSLCLILDELRNNSDAMEYKI